MIGRVGGGGIGAEREGGVLGVIIFLVWLIGLVRCLIFFGSRDLRIRRFLIGDSLACMLICLANLSRPFQSWY